MKQRNGSCWNNAAGTIGQAYRNRNQDKAPYLNPSLNDPKMGINFTLFVLCAYVCAGVH